MLTIQNTSAKARELAHAIIATGKTIVFDLDGVLLDASHRQNVYTQDHVDLGMATTEQIGALNLDAYRMNSTKEKIAQDKTMAMIEAIHILNDANVKYYVCTARVNCKHTQKLLQTHSIKPVYTMARSGEHDHRPDHQLKTSHLLARFDQRQRENMLLIDDNLRNCKAAIAVAMLAIHIPFEGH